MTPSLRGILQRPNVTDFMVKMAMHDLDTHWHLLSVAQLSYRIAKELRLDERTIQRTADGGLLHDVGKIEVRADILSAPRSLSKEEYLVIKGHPQAGAAIVAAWGEHEIAEIVLDHHERIDGSGYPSGKRSISVETQIVSAADVYDTMRYQRAYKIPRTREDVLEELHRLASHSHDREIVDALTRVVSTFEPGARETELRSVS